MACFGYPETLPAPPHELMSQGPRIETSERHPGILIARGDWTLAHAAALRGEVERALMAAVPGLRATIQLLPMDVEAHFDDPKDAA